MKIVLSRYEFVIARNYRKITAKKTEILKCRKIMFNFFINIKEQSFYVKAIFQSFATRSKNAFTIQIEYRN